MKRAINIFIVEDEKDLRDAYEMILSAEGYTTQCASNGKEALDHLEKNIPDIMLLDVYMPIMDGEEVLRIVRKQNYENLKIVVFSNMADTVLQQKLLDNGADMFVLKSSMGPNELIALIRTLEK